MGTTHTTPNVSLLFKGRDKMLTVLHFIFPALCMLAFDQRMHLVDLTAQPNRLALAHMPCMLQSRAPTFSSASRVYYWPVLSC